MPITDEERKYLKNKHRGGENNKKGSQYENFYAVYCIAKLMGECQSQLDAVHLTSQVEDAFVDDLLIERPTSEKIYHQLRDVQSLTWGYARLEYDFKRQMEISRENGESFCLRLVYSNGNPSLAEIPEEIALCTEAIPFPTCESLLQLLWSYVPFKEAISDIAVEGEEKENDKLFGIAGALLGAWESCGQKAVSIAKISEVARCLGKGYVNIKNYSDAEISEACRTILERCGLRFHISGIKLYWSNTNGRLNGEIEWTSDLEQRLLQEAPTDLLEVVALLS